MMNLMSLDRAVCVAHSIYYRIVDIEIDEISTVLTITNGEEGKGG